MILVFENNIFDSFTEKIKVFIFHNSDFLFRPSNMANPVSKKKKVCFPNIFPSYTLKNRKRQKIRETEVPKYILGRINKVDVVI